MMQFPVTFEPDAFDSDYLSLEEIETIAQRKVLESFDHKIASEVETIRSTQEFLPPHVPRLEPEKVLQEVVRNILIRNIDKYWQEHLLHIDHLRTEVHLRTVGQKDPLLEFKHEAFALFDAFSSKIKLEIAHALFKFEMSPAQKPQTPPNMIRAIQEPFRVKLSLLPEMEEVLTED
ncbi:MAG: hypothetical protein JSS09_05025 [Verrucomicrobia bacterium]|nr:hypothetical protein [Verrucomicrobiota bacterium]